MRRTPLVFTAVLLITVVSGSSLLSAQGRDRTPPTTPTNLVVTAATTTSVSLSWGPSVDTADNESEPGTIPIGF